MGNDLLLSIIWTTQEPEAVRFEPIREAIEALTADEAVARIQDIGSGAFDDPDGELNMGALRQQLHEDLDDFRLVWLGEDRRMAYRVRLGTQHTAITGGGSWGDSPTEEFDAWNRLIESGALEAGGFFK